jgi:hypothetical protein
MGFVRRANRIERHGARMLAGAADRTDARQTLCSSLRIIGDGAERYVSANRYPMSYPKEKWEAIRSGFLVITH